MEPSPYNLFFKAFVGPDYVGYNTFTNALLEFSPEDYNTAQKILSHPSETSPGRESDIKTMLEQNGFLVPEGSDYLKELKRRYFSTSSSLSLTIAPTLACNFRCIYCFETKRNESMSPATQEDLLQFVQDNVREKEALNVTWFGGEPLLATDSIIFLSEQMHRICAEKHVTFNNNSIITNGYLLSLEKAKTLKALGITSAQITLDGVGENHDKRRPLTDGSGTFEVICDNIRACCDILEISIRVNIDKYNRDAIYGLQEFFDRNKIENVTFYPGHVQSYTETCKNIDADCMAEDEYKEFSWEFELTQLSRGKHTPGYPSLLYGFCTANNPRGFVVAPSGLLFKCWNEISCREEAAVGSVSAGMTQDMEKNKEKWSSWHPFDNKECVTCTYLPLCMGGCPYIAMRLHRLSCSRFKAYLEETIGVLHALGRVYDVSSVIGGPSD